MLDHLAIAAFDNNLLEQVRHAIDIKTKPPGSLGRVEALSRVTTYYHRMGLAQTWRMFAPPSSSNYEIGYALEFDGGWSELLSLDDILQDRTGDRIILPRGQIRLGNHLRHPVFRKQRLDEEPFFRHYFPQLAAFYCFGDGRIDGLKKIRFYSIIRPIAPFFPPEEGEPAPSTEPIIRALYERGCDDR